VISLNRHDENKGYRPPYVSPLLPSHAQEELVRPKDKPRMTWGTSNLSQLGYFLAAAGVMLMIVDLAGTRVARFSLVFIWGPIVGVTAAVILWQGRAWMHRRSTFRSKPLS
jgi:hypothetical protein